MAGAIDWSDLLHPDFETIEGMLHHLYIEKEMSLKNISLFLGIDRVPLTRKLKSFGIPIRSKGRPRGNSKVQYDFREARPDNFSVYSRENEKRDCRNYADCLCYAAIKDEYCLPCADCDGKPQENHFLMREYILDFEDHHVENFNSTAFHYTDFPSPRSFDKTDLASIRRMIKTHNLSDRPMQASNFRFFRRTIG
jgi:hypothetical protein